MRKKKKKEEGREIEEESEQMREKGEEENESSALFWGSLHKMRVGVSVCERLQNVCVRAQLWVSECGLLHHLRCQRVHVLFHARSSFCVLLCVRLCAASKYVT